MKIIVARDLRTTRSVSVKNLDCVSYVRIIVIFAPPVGPFYNNDSTYT